MPIRIGTNVSSIAAQNALQKNVDQRDHALRSLSSGKRIVQASDDAAGFAIAENLRAQKRGLAASQRNTQDALSFIQVAEGGLNEQNNILIRMRELAIQASSGTLSDVERGFLNKEFTELKNEVDRIAGSTTFGSNKLLSGDSKSFEFQVGTHDSSEDRIDFKLEADARADAIGISGLNIDDIDDARDSLEDLDEGLMHIAEMRSEFGAIQSRLHIASNHLSTQYENIARAHSSIADADVAQVTADLAQANILSEIGVAVLAQANQEPMQAQRLIMRF